MKKFLSLLVLCLSPVVLAAEETIDYLSLGTKLLRDGYTERAGKALEKVDVEAEYFDPAAFYTAKGIYLHRQGFPVLSNIYLQAAVAQGQSNQSLYLYMARNYWQKREYAEVIAALDKAGELGKSEVMLAVRAEAYKQLGRMHDAWAVLDDAILRYPEDARFYRQKFNYLLELGLYLEAMNYADTYLGAEAHSAEEYMALGYALMKTGQLELAAALLEEGVARHPSHRKIVEMLAQVYIEEQAYFSAALVLDWASLRMPELAHKSAALYMKSASPVRALQLNRRVLDQKEKFRQRLGIDIELGDFEGLVAKESELARQGLLDDDRVKYAVGYGHFVTGNMDRARHWLKLIQEEEVFLKAIKLLNQIEECSSEPLNCL